jgi:predicted phage-related endonuclease
MSTYTYPAIVERVPVYPKDSQEWHAQRAQTIGASEISRVLGVSPYGGLIGLILQKRDDADGNGTRMDNEQMATGRDAEDTILKIAARQIGCTIHPAEALRRDCLSATPDGLIVNEAGYVTATVEAKLDRGRNDWHEVAAVGFAHLTGQDTRLAYYYQVQTQLAITGCSYGYLAIWTVYEFHLIRIEAHPTAARIIEEGARIATAWIQDPSGRLPSATEADSVSDLARTIHPRTDEPVEAAPEVAEAIERYAELSAQIKQLETEQDAAKRIILEAHTVSAKLSTAAGYKSAFVESTERRSLDAKALEAAEPETYARYVKTSKVSPSCRITAPRKK